MSNLLEGQGASANVRLLSTTDVFRKQASRGGVMPRRGRKLPLAVSQQSSAPDHPSSLLGKAASAEGPDTAAKLRGNGEIPCLWSEHRPRGNKISESPAELRRCYVWTTHGGLPTSGKFGRYCDRNNCRNEIIPQGSTSTKTLKGWISRPWALDLAHLTAN
jgi:hypothetical protein